MDWFRDRSALAADYLGQLDRYDEAPGFLREMFSSQQHWLSRYDPNEDDMVDHGVTDEMFRTERYEELKNEMDHMGKGLAKQPTSKLVRERETGSAKYAQETGAHRTQMLDNFLPTYFRRVAARYRVRVYNGKFSNDGSLFITASFDKNIRVYETNPHEDAEWNLVQRVSAPSFQWTITDTDVSPDKRSLVFSSLTPEVNYVELSEGSHARTLDFTGLHNGGRGIYGLRYSNDGEEVIAGGSDGSIMVYNLHRDGLNIDIKAHFNDVNSVCFLDGVGDLLVSGSDDTLCKLWDRREFSSATACAAFDGHADGITHVSPKGDGRYFISNAKDHSIKLWDIRKCSSNVSDVGRRQRRSYRYRPVVCPGLNPSNEVSVMTYTGHKVHDTLIRANFSPLETTLQKYIYTGSYEGTVYIYDVLTGKTVAEMAGHFQPVRDVSWHPNLPLLCSSGWDGMILLWGPKITRVPGDPIYSDFTL